MSREAEAFASLIDAIRKAGRVYEERVAIAVQKIALAMWQLDLRQKCEKAARAVEPEVYDVVVITDRRSDGDGSASGDCRATTDSESRRGATGGHGVGRVEVGE